MDRKRKVNGPVHNGPVMMTAEKPKNFSRAIKNLWGVLKPNKLAIMMTIILTIAATGLGIVSPKILGGMTNQIVDDYISKTAYEKIHENLPRGTVVPAGTTVKDLAKGNSEFENLLAKVPSAQRNLVENLDISEKPAFHYDKLAEIGVFLVILYLVSTLANYISGWIITGVIQRTMRRLRADLSRKINRLPIGYFDRNQYGNVLSRVTNDVDTIGQTLTQSFSQAFSAVFMIIGVVVMMITISWLMTLVAIGVILLSMLFVGMITKKTQRHFKNQQNQLGELNGHVEENYAGHLVVKAFGAEKRTINEFNGINRRLYTSSWKSQFLSGLMMPLMHVINNLGYVATAVLGGWLALNGRLSIGDIQAFIQYTGQMQQPITQVGQIMNLLQSTAAAAERVFDFLNEPDEPDTALKSPNALNHVKGNVSFSHVKFGYDKDKVIIKDFSADVKAGQTVAIVGPTGAGKTTIVNLLMRFYDPQSGVIKIDGVDTKTLSRQTVRQQFAMVLQDTWLFSGTVRENLAYGDLNASNEQIEKAAEAAHVNHFIRSLPHGYNTVLDEDTENISSGEKQLLTIARAMLADAPMLILDEATSSVDTRTEVLIQKAMRKLMHGRTAFVIAHRLSTIRDADLILVMQDGNIVEQGNHQQLLAKHGFYAKLYQSQFAED
jgi:ATP-binding cassette subfamily B protein